MIMGVSMWLGFISVVAVAQCIQIPIGVCPTPGRPTGVCGFGRSTSGCTTNSQCPSGFLCCLEGCGRQCKPALTLKVQNRAGYCPAPPTSSLVSCPTIIRNECHMDGDCEDSKKCCFHPCGSRCMNSFPQSRVLKQGICPLPQEPITCLGEIVDSCEIDDDCAGQLKCCFHPCGRSCLNVKRHTVMLKPGTCPMPYSGFCTLPRRDHCRSDGDCAGMQKCCSLPCGRSCVKSTPLMRSKVRSQQNPLCPPSDGSVGICVFDPEVNCISDSQCSDKGQLCCSSGCNSICKDPVKTILPIVKEGSCPLPISGELVRCAKIDICHTDSECNGTQKCCDHPCGARCASTVKTKPGTCPAVSKCEGFNDECFKDADCSGSQKCCDTKCGNRCEVSDPVVVPVPAGECPVPDAMVGICLFDPLKNCLGDQECASKGQLCCKDGCGSICKDPVPVTLPVVKQGTCPTPPNPALVLCATPITDNCTGDSSCKGDLKCCEHPCGKYCGLVRSKPGVCPAASLTTAECLSNSPQCDNDNDCPLTLKCCASSCGRSCVDVNVNPEPVPVTKPSKPGTCPTPPNPALVLCAAPITDNCTGDSSCKGDLKCCEHPCGKYCGLVRSKPGVCPAASLTTAECLSNSPQCDNDNDCPLSLKCCASSCGRSCVDVNVNPAPVPVTKPSKPGTCPTPPNPALVLCAAPITDNCTGDSSCKGDLKCCEHPCGKYCGLVRSKPGVCPAASLTTAECLSNSPQCDNDNDCPLTLKCCASSCGRSCVDVNVNPAPVPVTKPSKPGTCPTPPNPALVLCATPITDNCTGDSSCNGDLKCCEHPCGKYCGLVRSKPGVCPAASLTTAECLSNSPQCDNDNDCPLSLKCCASSCGRSCVDVNVNPAPVPVTKPSKPGRCPQRRLNFRIRCWLKRNFCDNDYSCRGNAKCCQGRCGRRCVRPRRETRRGGCPTPQANVQCFREQNDCETDRQCGRGRKCCPTECGVGCVRVRPYFWGYFKG